MTKDESKIKDWRSTGRRKGRRALYQAYVPFKCVDCGKTNTTIPADAPHHFDEIWPEENRVLDNSKSQAAGLQVDHITKDVTNNEVENLCWRCPKHHKEADGQTATGVAQIEKKYW